MNWNAFVEDNDHQWRQKRPFLSQSVRLYAKLLGIVINLQEMLAS